MIAFVLTGDNSSPGSWIEMIKLLTRAKKLQVQQNKGSKSTRARYAESSRWACRLEALCLGQPQSILLANGHHSTKIPHRVESSRFELRILSAHRLSEF